ncbi:MAG: D-2-hydroxyacid dehydrogenase [Acidimicrobiia bacterium]|nr:D-2-hydroxyacid dehydrogenase [Acidimicrobiia bacterium]
MAGRVRRRRPGGGAGQVNVLVITGLTLPAVSEEDVARVQDAAGPGAKVTVVGRVREAVAIAGDVEVVLGVVPPPLLEAAPKLRWVHATASGVDGFLYPAFRDGDVVLTGEKGLVGGHLADHAFGLLLALTRRIAAAVRLGAGGWDHRERMRQEELELESLVMGIVGFGGTGRAMARRARAFGMTCLAVDEPGATPGDGVAEVWPTSRLHDLLGASDVVAVCCPLTDSTRGLFDDARFAAMKPGAILLNVTRGEVVDGDALVRALSSGTLGGAGLDVAPLEPLPAEHPLWGFENVVMTPHTAGASQHRARRNLERFCDNLRRYRNGDELVGVVDKQAGF